MRYSKVLHKTARTNHISNAVGNWQDVIKSPLASALLLGGGAVAATKLGYRPITSALGRFAIANTLAKMPDLSQMTPEEAAQVQQQVEAQRAQLSALFEHNINEPKAKSIVPWAIGGLTAAGTAAANWRSNEEGKGLFKWNPGFVQPEDSGYYRDYIPKKASAAADLGVDIDFHKDIATRKVVQYIAASGIDHESGMLFISIIRKAAINKGSSNIQLGAIYDEAARKFKVRLMLYTDIGLVKAGEIADSMAALFTRCVSIIYDLKDEERREVLDSGAFASALLSIIGETDE